MRVINNLLLRARRFFRAAPDPDDDISIALTRGGWSYGRDCDVEFVKSALAGEDAPTGMALRRHGVRLTKDELRALGYRANLILTHECLDILTEKGRRYPADSAQYIVSLLVGLRYKKRHLSDLANHELFAEFMPSNMAAGPCPHAEQLAGHKFDPKHAPIPPFVDCPHPDQCGCTYQASLD